MKLVVTHQNPDFDALASAVLACRIHGCDGVAVVTSFEHAVHQYVKLDTPTLPVIRMKEKDISDIESLEQLVITDCKSLSRLGSFKSLVPKAKKVIIYDHHPAYQKDITGTEETVASVGSTTTLLVEECIRKQIELPQEELNLALLGIYQDTGMLTFSITTPRDMDAASFLLKSGGSLNPVTEYVKRDISREQVFVLNELFMNLTITRSGGISVGVSFSSVEQYVDEVSYLAHRMMEVESLDSLFVLVRTGSRIILVGRSKVTEVDASQVVSHFGGGGHPTAASATLKEMPLPEAWERLKAVIRESIRPVKTAREVMTSPVRYVTPDTTFDGAMDIFMRSNLNAMPVVENGRTVGLISRRDIMHGMKHNFTDHPVGQIMQVEFMTLRPEMPYYVAEEIMLGRNQKLMPVEDETGLLGVITRTDLLRLMHEQTARLTREQEGWRAKMGLAKVRNVANLLHDRLPDKYVDLLKELGDLARDMGYKCYTVGGFVRDLLMRNDNFDIDIVVEGDAPRLAKAFAKKKKGKASIHFTFKTAVVIFPDGFRVDFATARTEYYALPAAAPEVEDASIRNDLYRRDFTVNAMALRISDHFGQLIDFYGGQRDIQEKKIRVLHSLSFVDDPSRGFRAIRFAVRFGFEIGAHTERLLQHAEGLNLFDRIVGKRLFLELKYILSESTYPDAMQMMKQYNLLRFFHPDVAFDERMKGDFSRLERIYGWYSFQFSPLEIWKTRLCVLLGGVPLKDIPAVADRFDLDGKYREEFTEMISASRNAAVSMRKQRKMTPAALCDYLDALPVEYVLHVAVILGADAEQKFRNYLTSLRGMRLCISGNDLKEMGFKPSPRFAEALKKTLAAKRNGDISGRDAELAFARTILEETGVE